MLWIDASRVHAQVVCRLSWQQGPHEQFEACSVGPDLLPVVRPKTDIEESVAVCVHRPAPVPAAALVSLDLGEKPLQIRDGAGRSGHATEYTEFIGRQLIDCLEAAA